MKYPLKHLFDTVSVGESRRFNCPACLGFNTLSITKDGIRVSYNCFKNSCILRGHTRIIPSKDALKSLLEPVTVKEAPFHMPDYWIKGISSKTMLNLITKTHCLEVYQKGLFKVAYDPQENRCCYLITDHTGNVTGAIGRSLFSRSGIPRAKTQNYGDVRSYPFNVGQGAWSVLVEDCASAASMARIANYTGIALLGTSLKESYIKHIVKYDKVIVALDRDARNKAMQIKDKLKYYHPNVSVWLLEKDIKDMSNEELQELVYANNN